VDSQFLQPGMLPGGKQLSGMFLATTVNLSVTGLPGDGEDAALGPYCGLPG
jgi:hypothetical protein